MTNNVVLLRPLPPPQPQLPPARPATDAEAVLADRLHIRFVAIAVRAARKAASA